jgi:RNA polymerase sigma-70 factor (ECF subfamily)
MMMLGAKQGDIGALDHLVEKHHGRVRHYVYRVVQDEAVSEELAQEVFLRVHRNREKYQPTARFTTWLFQIANHVALNWIRDHQYERQDERLDSGTTYHHVAAREMSIDDWLILGVKVRAVRQAVEELPERQRTVVLMHKFEELECEEIGEILGCSNQAVRSLLCRAYRTLRERLAPMAPVC